MASFFKKRPSAAKGDGAPAEEQELDSVPAADESSDPSGKKERRPRGRKSKEPAGGEKPKRRPLFSFSRRKKKVDETAGAAATPETPAETVPAAAKEKKSPRQKEARKKRSRSAGGIGNPPIGLDIDRSSITAVSLRHRAEGTSLLSVAVDRLPEGLIEEGEVRDVEGLGIAIRDFWKNHNIKGRKVNIGLANQKIVVRTLEFPLLEEKELRSAVEFQAQDYIPIPIEEAVLDIHVLGTFTDENQIEKQKVLVVAAQKEMVMDFMGALKKAKLSVEDIDLQAFALSRSLTNRTFLEEGTRSDQAVAIVNIAADVTNLIVDVGGEPLFTRIISFGGNDFTRAVQEQLNVSFDEAEIMKANVGLASPAEQPPETAPEGEPGVVSPVPPEGPSEEQTLSIPPSEAGQPPVPQPPQPVEPPRIQWDEEEHMDPDSRTRRALEIAADSFGDEVRRSLDYYHSQDESVPLVRLILSGRGSMMKDLSEYLKQMFPYDVEMGNPLDRIRENSSELSDEELQALSPHLSIAIGLALEDES